MYYNCQTPFSSLRLGLRSRLGQYQVLFAIHNIKCIFCSGVVTPNDIKNLEEEVLKMEAFKHPNVMSLIGLCENFCGGPAIVMPFMANGSVLDYLRRERKSLVLSAEAEESMVCTLKTVQ